MEAGMQIVWRCLSLNSLFKHGYSEKSANIDVRFFSNGVFQEKKSLL